MYLFFLLMDKLCAMPNVWIYLNLPHLNKYWFKIHFKMQSIFIIEPIENFPESPIKLCKHHISTVGPNYWFCFTVCQVCVHAFCMFSLYLIRCYYLMLFRGHSSPGIIFLYILCSLCLSQEDGHCLKKPRKHAR